MMALGFLMFSTLLLLYIGLSVSNGEIRCSIDRRCNNRRRIRKSDIPSERRVNKERRSSHDRRQLVD